MGKGSKRIGPSKKCLKDVINLETRKRGGRQITVDTATS